MSALPIQPNTPTSCFPPLFRTQRDPLTCLPDPFQSPGKEQAKSPLFDLMNLFLLGQG